MLPSSYSHTWKVVNVFDFKIGKVIHNLDFVIGAPIHYFPQTGFCREMIHLFYLQVGKVIYHLYVVIREAAYELNTSVDL